MQCQNPCSAAFNRLNELLVVHFECHFNLISQLNNSFFFYDAYSNPSTQLRAQNNDFGADLQTDLTRTLVSSVAQADVLFSMLFCFPSFSPSKTVV